MAIRKLPQGKWHVDVTIGLKANGKRDRRTKVCATKAEADKVERSLLARKDAHLISGRITMAEFIETTFWQQKQHLRPNTLRGYERDIRLRILPAFGNTYLEDINRANIQNMLLSCPTKKVATNARETLSSILKLACEMNLLLRNPAGYCYQYPQEGIHAKDHYGAWLTTFKQHQEFFVMLHAHNHNPMIERMCVLGLCFGLRKGEIIGLDWEQIDLERGTLSVVQTCITGNGGAFLYPPKTKQSVRAIPLPSYAHKKLSEWHAQDTKRQVGASARGPLIRTRSGERMHPSSAQSMLRFFLKRHPKLPQITLHSMRHSFATACINAEVEVSKVAAWLGHRKVSTTYNRYVKPQMNDLQKEVRAIDRAFYEVEQMNLFDD